MLFVEHPLIWFRLKIVPKDLRRCPSKTNSSYNDKEKKRVSFRKIWNFNTKKNINLQCWLEVSEHKKRRDQQNDQEQAVIVEDRVGSGLEFGYFVFLPEDAVFLVLLHFLVALGHFTQNSIFTLLSDPILLKRKSEISFDP